jgi:hypothetical protein
MAIAYEMGEDMRDQCISTAHHQNEFVGLIGLIYQRWYASIPRVQNKASLLPSKNKHAANKLLLINNCWAAV